jgi:hypothetical protein
MKPIDHRLGQRLILLDSPAFTVATRLRPEVLPASTGSW